MQKPRKLLNIISFPCNFCITFASLLEKIMNKNEYPELVDKLLKFVFTYGLRSFSVNDLCKKLGIPKPVFLKYFRNKTDLVEQLLDFEHNKFKSIFTDYDFEGVNAIKILLIVNKELALRYKDISPSIAFDLQKYYPEQFQLAYEKDRQIVKEKILINLKKGIDQGMYREDIKQDLIADLYMAKLIELHDPQNLPEDFSFGEIVEFIIDFLIRGIATVEGLAYYEKEKKNFKII